MSWFGTKQEQQRMRPFVVALEALSPDMLHAQLELLERELYTAGCSVRRLAFPSETAEQKVPALFAEPQLLQSAQSVGLVAAVDRASVLSGLESVPSTTEVVLLTGGLLHSAAWTGVLFSEASERVALYRWLDELEHAVLGQRRVDLNIYVDILPEHIDLQEHVYCPVGWGSRPAPEIEVLRACYLEAANLLPKTKVVAASRDGLLKPDSDIGNEVWNLVRRIVLKTEMPQRGVQ